MKKPIVPAVLDGAQQIAVPAFVSTLAICIVFVPVLLLTGPARYLFTPLAMAVVFAILTSYLLTRTLVPTMVHFLLPPEVKIYQMGEEEFSKHDHGFLWRMHNAFNRRFEALRSRYHSGLAWALHHRRRDRHRLLPLRRFRPDAPARAHAGRHSHRADRADLRPGGG